jgi:glycerol-3-phosphate acyltransferase PlsY
LKGVVAVLIARELSAQPWIISATMLAVFLGHLFPVFFGFKGGKGVATALGAYLGASPWVGGALALSWVVVAVVSRYSSLSALVATALSPIFVWYWLGDPAYIIGSVLMAVILFWRHHGNIKRLLDGSESKIGK